MSLDIFFSQFHFVMFLFNHQGSEENIKPNNNDSRTKHSKSDGEDNREDNEKDHKTKRGVEQDEPDAGVSKTKVQLKVPPWCSLDL